MFGQSQEEAAFIDELARDKDPNDFDEYWIGLYRNEKGILGENENPYEVSILKSLSNVFEKIDLN